MSTCFCDGAASTNLLCSWMPLADDKEMGLLIQRGSPFDPASGSDSKPGVQSGRFWPGMVVVMVAVMMVLWCLWWWRGGDGVVVGGVHLLNF